MPTLTFEAARACVIETVKARRAVPEIEYVPIEEAYGRVLAMHLAADRDYPATARSIRDGFAVRASDLPGRLRVIGEVRAGEAATAPVGAGECIEIMTGAPVPAGADAVVMIEHVRRDGDYIDAPAAEPGQYVNPQGSEARAGDRLLEAGRRLDYTGIAMLASAGHTSVGVRKRPRVAIVSTGDEIVDARESPRPFEVRNSNTYSLAAQVRRAGAIAEVLPIARDTHEATTAIVERALACDLALLSGGVSAGKYDVVEPALASFGADFYFDRVLIQPGQPLVFGRIAKTFFFGLPGNPASTMVTFEIFARAAVELLEGQNDPELPLTLARLAAPFRHKPGLTRFLPARLSAGAELTPVPWHGSSDIPALARSNAFLVADADRESWNAGDHMRVLMR